MCLYIIYLRKCYFATGLTAIVQTLTFLSAIRQQALFTTRMEVDYQQWSTTHTKTDDMFTSARGPIGNACEVSQNMVLYSLLYILNTVIWLCITLYLRYIL